MTTGTAENGTGLYLHIPFCAARCDYCDFNTYAGMDDEIPRYVAALRQDLARTAALGPGGVAPPGAGADDWPPFTSIFVGGGTPTLLDPDDLAGIVGLAGEMLPLADDCEITVEANPETVTVPAMSALAAAGVNRVSMGAQSFSPQVLATLGRWHDYERPIQAVEDVRAAGISRVSMDLIYGTPSESDEDWRRTMETALATAVDHISAYALTVEPNTAYARRVVADPELAPDDDLQADRMTMADDTFRAAGLRRYELSNWARPGQECRHNLTYWRHGNWLGLGAGAHGHWAGRRWWNYRAPGRYSDMALSGQSTVSGAELLAAGERRTERLLLGLRTVEGVSADEVAPVDPATVKRMVTAGFLQDISNRLALTDSGFRMANGVTVALL